MATGTIDGWEKGRIGGRMERRGGVDGGTGKESKEEGSEAGKERKKIS